MIALTNLALTAGKRTVLAGIDATFERGAFTAVLGANGAGKTTLLRGIAGLRAPAEGSIRIDGVDVHALPSTQRALRVAMIAADEVVLEGLTVREVVATGRFPHHRWWEWNERPQDREAVARALDDVALADFARRPIETLSSGERQRAWIALGLAQETPVLLLDEPTSHLDVRAAHVVLRLLRGLCAAGKTIVCVLHDVNEAAAFADRVALIGDGGIIAAGACDTVLERTNLERAYGIAMERVAMPDGSVRLFVPD
ncbi:MAG TPA: ABC transporter ATP-binding protein [Candidatus Tumulicola sp.]|jgi:iron complex transport system ATP-binding protein